MRTFILSTAMGLLLSVSVAAGQMAGAPDGALTMEQALAIAMAQTGGGTVVETQVETKYGYTVYEFEIINNGVKYEFEIDASGAIRQMSQKSGYFIPPVMNAVPQAGMPQAAVPNAMPVMPAPQIAVPNSGMGAISQQQAQAIALNHAGGGMVRKAEQDYEHGRLVYEFEIINNGRKYEIDVDAAGNVVKFDIDD